MNTRHIFVVLFILVWEPTLHAAVLTRNVVYKDADVTLEGFLAYEDAVQGRRPGVLVVHEWWGLNDYVRRRVEQLAALGYVAFGLDMYGKGKVTEHPSQASEWMKQIRTHEHLWQRRALAGMIVLKNLPHVDTNRIAAIGYCFGGTTVQQLAYSHTQIKGVVSFHGSLQLPPSKPIQGSKTKILICHGAADPFVSGQELLNYMAAMESSGFDWQMIVYGGAKHSFTNPGADSTGMAALKYSQQADQRSWAAMQQFFNEIFATP